MRKLILAMVCLSMIPALAQAQTSTSVKNVNGRRTVTIKIHGNRQDALNYQARINRQNLQNRPYLANRQNPVSNANGYGVYNSAPGSETYVLPGAETYANYPEVVDNYNSAVISSPYGYRNEDYSYGYVPERTVNNNLPTLAPIVSQFNSATQPIPVNGQYPYYQSPQVQTFGYYDYGIRMFPYN